MNTATNQKRPQQAEYHHGRSPAAWTGSLVCMLGFIVATVAFVLPGLGDSSTMSPSMPLLGLGAALIAIGAIATLVMKSMGYGNPPRDL
ncbi:HGxxPAAW family protein [Luteococcus sanguinis]|uniref:HGxxPAAW family protein n=1 Tax=Luteococcus sanguinis TaxID=174038 RepID=A0ABW1X2B3_9ACTN